MMVKKNIALIPTLGVYHQILNPDTGRSAASIKLHVKIMEPLKESYKIAIGEGVKIGMGLDSNGRLCEEMELIKSLGGIDINETIRICTSGNAEILGVDDRLGSIEEGKIADMVILDADPLEDLNNIEKIAYVVKEGCSYRPDEIRLRTEAESEDYNSIMPELTNTQIY